MSKRSAWEGKRVMSYLYDPYYVADMPTNEERLQHLDFYTRANSTAPTVGGGKRGGEGFGKYDEEPWMEEHTVEFEYDMVNHDGKGIRRVE